MAEAVNETATVSQTYEPSTPKVLKRSLSMLEVPNKKQKLEEEQKLMPEVPNTKRRLRDEEQPNAIFDQWMLQWRGINLKYTNVDISLHRPSSDKPRNFMMLSQRQIKSHMKHKVMVHYKMIPRMIKEFQRVYEKLSLEHGATPKELSI